MSIYGDHPSENPMVGVKHSLKRVLNFKQLITFYIVAIFGIRLLPAAASAGPSIVIYFILALVIFFIPMGLTVMDLGKRLPEEGGIYIWSKTAFGDFHGYITAWTYWTANLAFFPSMLFFASTQILLIFPVFEPLRENNFVLATISVVIILFVLWMNIRGLRPSNVLNKLSLFSTYIAVILLVLIALINWVQFGPATDMSLGNWAPSLGSLKDLVFLSTVVYLFAGLECASMLSDEVHEPKKTIPRAIVVSGIIITLMYLISSFSLLVAVPADQLDDLTGMTNATYDGVYKFSGVALAEYSSSLMSFLLVMMTVGGLSVWLTTTARLPFVVGLDKYLPEVFGKLHPKYDTPYISLIALSIVTIFLVVLSGMGEKALEVYNILISLEIVTFLIPYLYMFGAVIKFEVDNKYKGKVDIPGGHKNALAAGVLGFLIILASIFLGLVPGDDVEDPSGFYFTVFVSLTINLLIGIGIFMYSKRKRKLNSRTQV